MGLHICHCTEQVGDGLRDPAGLPPADGASLRQERPSGRPSGCEVQSRTSSSDKEPAAACAPVEESAVAAHRTAKASRQMVLVGTPRKPRPPFTDHGQTLLPPPRPRVKYPGVAPLHVRAAWARLSLHVAAKEAAHHEADEAAE